MNPNTFMTKRPVAYWMLLLVPFNIMVLSANKWGSSNSNINTASIIVLLLLFSYFVYLFIKMKKHSATSTVVLDPSFIMIADQKVQVEDIDRLIITNYIFKLHVKGKWSRIAYSIDPNHREDIARKLVDYSIQHELTLVNRVKASPIFSL
ncbi:hypothetical protein [Paenibacillus paeoniae]|uniref:Uncharacterized protein n=1 Tax=Paenibacillus paeoniae TaxID=2292705 RepID=A0A371PLG1_9BACL|nr:hypothetical protein [Paenibacillus paeoniae]REK77031.1 hypothetical protein DX130_08475 [Paenibacillus paeoniae]